MRHLGRTLVRAKGGCKGRKMSGEGSKRALPSLQGVGRGVHNLVPISTGVEEMNQLGPADLEVLLLPI